MKRTAAAIIIATLTLVTASCAPGYGDRREVAKKEQEAADEAAKKEVEERAAAEEKRAAERAAKRKEAIDKAARKKAADKAAKEKKEAADKAAKKKAAQEKKKADDKAAKEKKKADDKAAKEKKKADDKAAKEKKKAADKAKKEAEARPSVCESDPGGAVNDEPGAVASGGDLRKVVVALDGDDLVVTWHMAGDTSAVAPDAEGGFWSLMVGKDSIDEFQLSVDVIDGKVFTGVFNMTEAENDPDVAEATIEDTKVSLRVPRSAVGGVAKGWRWQGHSESGYDMPQSDRCPLEGDQEL